MKDKFDIWHGLNQPIVPNTIMRTEGQETLHRSARWDSWEVKLWVRAHSPFYRAANSVYGNTIFTVTYPVFDFGDIRGCQWWMLP